MEELDVSGGHGGGGSDEKKAIGVDGGSVDGLLSSAEKKKATGVDGCGGKKPTPKGLVNVLEMEREQDDEPQWLRGLFSSLGVDGGSIDGSGGKKRPPKGLLEDMSPPEKKKFLLVTEKKKAGVDGGSVDGGGLVNLQVVETKIQDYQHRKIQYKNLVQLNPEDLRKKRFWKNANIQKKNREVKHNKNRGLIFDGDAKPSRENSGSDPKPEADVVAPVPWVQVNDLNEAPLLEGVNLETNLLLDPPTSQQLSLPTNPASELLAPYVATAAAAAAAADNDNDAADLIDLNES